MRCCSSRSSDQSDETAQQAGGQREDRRAAYRSGDSRPRQTSPAKRNTMHIASITDHFPFPFEGTALREPVGDGVPGRGGAAQSPDGQKHGHGGRNDDEAIMRSPRLRFGDGRELEVPPHGRTVEHRMREHRAMRPSL